MTEYAELEFNGTPPPSRDNLTDRQRTLLLALAGEIEDKVIVSEDEIDWLLFYGFISPRVVN